MLVSYHLIGEKKNFHMKCRFAYLLSIALTKYLIFLISCQINNTIVKQNTRNNKSLILEELMAIIHKCTQQFITNTTFGQKSLFYYGAEIYYKISLSLKITTI